MSRLLPALALAAVFAPALVSADGPIPKPPPWPTPKPRPARAAPPSLPGSGGVPAPPVAPPPGRPSEPGVGRIVLDFDPNVGRLSPFVVDDDTLAVVMTGNPHVHGEDDSGQDYSVKAHTIVVWLDRHKTPELVGFMGTPAPPAAGKPRAPAARILPGGHPSVFPEAILGVYAEGAVDLRSGTLAFRASVLYFDPRASYALLVEPRFETQLAVLDKDKPSPVEVRADRARIVAGGLAVFDRADVATSRASDRIELRVRSLTVEEFGNAAKDEALMLGFRSKVTQHYHAEGLAVRGERLPLGWWPSASFGYDGEKGKRFPVQLLKPEIGTRSSLGKYLKIPVGGDLGPENDPWANWRVAVGGYTKRGPSLGVEIGWNRPRVSGRFVSEYVNDGGGHDRNDFVAPSSDRWKESLESRVEVSRSLRLDVEANVYSDRGFNREFFPDDDRNGKDKETYGRLRYVDGGFAATLTAMAHARDFVTESVPLPEAALWSESVPLVSGSGGIGLDLSSFARASRRLRRFDEDLALPGYEANRFEATERLYAPFGLGPVRVSPFVGGRYVGYADRTDGGEDLARTALEAGIRFDLQLHRDYETYGGFLRLDGLRHVIDVDVEGYGRWLDDHRASEVPYFDDVDLEEDRTEIVLQVRNRLDTRRVVGGDRRGDAVVGGALRNATVIDLLTRLSYWPEGRGPYGEHGWGSLRTRLDAIVLPDELEIRADTLYAIGDDLLERSSIGASWSPSRTFSLSGGLRQVHGEVMAPWLDAYERWNDKWGVRLRAIYDTENAKARQVRVSFFRFSPDHAWEFGAVYKENGRDFGLYFNFDPSVSGDPLNDPYHPREDIGYLP